MPDPCAYLIIINLADVAATNNKVINFQINGFKTLIPIRVHKFLPHAAYNE